jgi:glutaredoxin
MVSYYLVYALGTCPYCIEAIKLLEKNGFQYSLTLLDNCPQHRAFLKNKYEWDTVPMIVEMRLDGTETFVGGFDDLSKYFAGISEEITESCDGGSCQL